MINYKCRGRYGGCACENTNKQQQKTITAKTNEWVIDKWAMINYDNVWMLIWDRSSRLFDLILSSEMEDQM